MVNDRRGNQDGLVAEQTQAKTEIDILQVTEEVLVEAVGFEQRAALVQRCGSAGGENLPRLVRQRIRGLAVALPPGRAASIAV